MCIPPHPQITFCRPHVGHHALRPPTAGRVCPCSTAVSVMDDTPYGRASLQAREERSVHLQKQRSASLSLARPSTSLPAPRQLPHKAIRVLRATGGRQESVSVTTLRDRLSETPALLDPADVLLGTEIARRFGGAFDLMLPPEVCPEAVRLAVRQLALWVLARSDAGRLDATSLVEVMTEGSGRPVNTQGDRRAAAGGPLLRPPAAARADSSAQRGGLGNDLLNPIACGALAHLAFDAAAENPELREFFQALHALLSAVLVIGADKLLPALRDDAGSKSEYGGERKVVLARSYARL